MNKFILPIASILLVITGCENSMRSESSNLDSVELQELSSELTYDLGLSKSSTDAMNKSLNRHGKGGKHREPGFLWKVAAEMSDQLTDEEKAVLFEKMDEKDIPLFGGSKGKKSKSGKKGKSQSRDLFNMLTDDQKDLYKAMMAAYKEKFKSLRDQVKDGSLSKEDAKVQMKSLKDALRAEVDALLTDDQKAQLEQNKADRNAKRQAYRDSSKAVMVEVLGMTEDQVSAYDVANQEAKDATSALFEQAKNGDIDRETLRASLKLVFTAKNEKLTAIFDNQQLDIIKIRKALEMRMKKHRSSKGDKARKGKKSRKGKKGSRSKG